MSDQDRQYTDQRKKGKTANNVQHNLNYKQKLHSCATEGKAVPTPLVAPVVLILSKFRCYVMHEESTSYFGKGDI